MNIRSFEGFSEEGLGFLQELSANNNKPWFEANRERYIEHLQKPAVALVMALGERLHKKFPSIGYDTRTNGGGSLMRQYRDTRFSADKTPYKTNLAMMFSSASNGKMAAPGFGLQITPEQVELIAGVFQFTPEDLESYRKAVLDKKLGPKLEHAAAAVQKPGVYKIEGVSLKNAPRGYDPGHPLADWLKFKGLYVLSPVLPLKLAGGPGLVEEAMKHFEAMAPIEQWLEEVLKIGD